MNTKRRTQVLLLIILLIAAISGGYYYQSLQDKTFALYGNVEVRTVNLSFRVGGKLASFEVDEGAQVKAGQLLGKLDDAPYINA